MSRALAAMITALSTTNVRAEYLLDIDYSGGALHLWTGVRDITISGTSYDAAGTFQGVSGIEETSELRAVGTQVTVSGIPAANITLALTENYRNRDLTFKLACINSSDNSVVADPVTLFKGKIDQETIMERGETATIAIAAESKLIDLGRTRRLLFTHEDQQLYSAGDKGCEYVSGLANEPFTWGA